MKLLLKSIADENKQIIKIDNLDNAKFNPELIKCLDFLINELKITIHYYYKYINERGKEVMRENT